MARYKIFISYSKKDREFLDSFRKHLAPFENDAELSIWSDERIPPGEDWDREIRAAMSSADAAVLMVSPDLLATRYVTEVEIPFLMEAAAGRLLFTPLFVRASNAGAKRFDQVLNPRTGEYGGAKITDFQGLNRPDQPIASLSPADRDTLLAECARRLWDRLEERPSPRERRRAVAAKTVTVELQLRGRHLDRTYSQPGAGPFRQNTTEVDLGLLQGSLHRGDVVALGERLFEILFGSERAWSQILPKVVGKAGTPAAHFGVRTRILTEHETLLDLPWPCCHWRGHSLAEQGWTFELVSHRERASPVWLEAPCTVLIVGSEIDSAPTLSVEAHWSSFQGLLHRAWDHPSRTDFRWARSVTETMNALEDSPRLVYVYAHAQQREKQAGLMLRGDSGEPEWLPLDRLAEAMTRRPPTVMVLNTVGACPPAPPLAGIPVVLHLRHEAPTFEARSQAMVFWNDVLEGRWDPVKAFHELGPGARLRGSIRTDYEALETRLANRTPKIGRARSRLDRRMQRESVMGIIRDLVSFQNRRLTCVIVYGSPGNMVEHFAEQVTDTLKDWALELARIQRHPLSFPSACEVPTSVDFEEHLREYLHVQPEQRLSEGFATPRRGGPTATPVHFVDWGCHGIGRAALPSGQVLGTWLTFCCERLAAAVEGPERILSYVALVLPNERHEGLRRFVDAQSRQPLFQKAHFHIQHLQPLEKVKPEDLRIFLADDENTSCDPPYRHEIAERICLETGGEFETTVQLLEEAEHGNLWPELYRTLPKAEPPPPVEDF